MFDDEDLDNIDDEDGEDDSGGFVCANNYYSDLMRVIDNNNSGQSPSVPAQLQHILANISWNSKRPREELRKITCLQRFLSEQGYATEASELNVISTVLVSPTNLRSATTLPQLLLPSRPMSDNCQEDPHG